MQTNLTRPQAVDLLRTYNQEPFHLRHALTVEAVMVWFARELGYGEDAAQWGLAGLLHDIDFERWPEEHCLQAPKLLEAAGASQELIRAVCSHGWKLTVDIEPRHTMEKVLYATDELTGLIGAAALMMPGKTVRELQLKTLKKKFKDKRFAAGCSREVIEDGAGLLGWTLDELMEKTLAAMQESEEAVSAELARWLA